MTISVAELRGYIGSPEADDTFLEECIDSATALLDTYIDGAEVPTAIYKQCELIVSGDLYQRRNSPQGLSQFAAMDGQPVRVPKDVLSGVYPLLNRFIEVGL